MIYKMISVAVCAAAGVLCLWLYSRYCSKDKKDLAICSCLSLLISAFVFILMN